MTTVYARRLEQGRLRWRPDGLEVTEVYDVHGLTGAPERRLWDAVNDPGIPRPGAPHPAVPGIQVVDFDAREIDADKVSVTVLYAPPTAYNDQPYDPETSTGERGTVSISAATVNETTRQDAAGRLLSVAYTGTVTGDDGVQLAVENDVYVGEADVLRPQTVIAVSRREQGSPLAWARVHVGTVNAYRLGAYEAKTLLLARVDADSEDGGVTYTVRYEFLYRPEGWRARIYWLDPTNGLPALDASAGNGRDDFDVYSAADFSTRGLAL